MNLLLNIVKWMHLVHAFHKYDNTLVYTKIGPLRLSLDSVEHKPIWSSPLSNHNPYFTCSLVIIYSYYHKTYFVNHSLINTSSIASTVCPLRVERDNFFSGKCHNNWTTSFCGVPYLKIYPSILETTSDNNMGKWYQ